MASLATRTSPISTISCILPTAGNERGTPEKRTVARFSSRYETPMAEMSSEMRGASRRGR